MTDIKSMLIQVENKERMQNNAERLWFEPMPPGPTYWGRLKADFLRLKAYYLRQVAYKARDLVDGPRSQATVENGCRNLLEEVDETFASWYINVVCRIMQIHDMGRRLEALAETGEEAFVPPTRLEMTLHHGESTDVDAVERLADGIFAETVGCLFDPFVVLVDVLIRMDPSLLDSNTSIRKKVSNIFSAYMSPGGPCARLASLVLPSSTADLRGWQIYEKFLTNRCLNPEDQADVSVQVLQKRMNLVQLEMATRHRPATMNALQNRTNYVLNRAAAEFQTATPERYAALMVEAGELNHEVLQLAAIMHPGGQW